jgi:hypothetical protein
MADDGTTPQPSGGDASEGGATSARPDDETKPPANIRSDQRQEPAGKNDRFGRWGAVIGQNGAVIAAVIAAMAAIGSAIVAAYTSAHNSVAQSHAAAVLAERNEREKLYADFATNMYDLDFVTGQLIGGLKDSLRTNADPLKTNNDACPNDLLEKRNDAFLKWRHSAYATQIAVDSAQVGEVLNKNVDLEEKILANLGPLCDDFVHSQFDKLQAALSEFDKLLQSYGDTDRRFIDVAHDDLQKLGYGEN